MNSRRFTWVVLILLVVGCTLVIAIPYLGNADQDETYYVFEPAAQYDLHNVDNSLKLLWTFTPEERIMNPVVLDSGRAAYFQTHEAIYSVNPSDGSVQWRHPVKDPLLDSLQVFITPFEDLVLVPTATERILQGLDAATGRIVWELPFYNHVSARSGRPQMVDIAIDRERAYVLLSLARGTALLAVDPRNGEVLWEAPNDLRDGLPGAILQDDDSAYLYLTGGGAIWKLDKEDGHIIQKIDRPVKTSRQPTYADGVAYTSGGPARAVDLETGEILWSAYPSFCDDKRDRTVFEPPILDGDAAYLLTVCEYMAQVDLATGRQRWLAEVSPLAHSFEPVGGTGYALTPYGDLYAVNISNGETEVVMSLEPPEIGGTTYRHLVSDGDILILTPGNNQAFAFAIP